MERYVCLNSSSIIFTFHFQQTQFFPRLIRYRHPEARKNEGGAFDSKSGLCTFLNTYIEENGLTNVVIEESLDSHLPNFEKDFRELEIVAAKFIDAAQ